MLLIEKRTHSPCHLLPGTPTGPDSREYYTYGKSSMPTTLNHCFGASAIRFWISIQYLNACEMKRRICGTFLTVCCIFCACTRFCHPSYGHTPGHTSGLPLSTTPQPRAIKLWGTLRASLVLTYMQSMFSMESDDEYMSLGGLPCRSLHLAIQL